MSNVECIKSLSSLIKQKPPDCPEVSVLFSYAFCSAVDDKEHL